MVGIPIFIIKLFYMVDSGGGGSLYFQTKTLFDWINYRDMRQLTRCGNFAYTAGQVVYANKWMGIGR
jgi:hypothetical protein